MRAIPKKVKKQLEADQSMKHCIYKNCTGIPEWEHAFIYAGKQLQEPWAIVPACTYHHRGKGLDKRYNEYRALLRADLDDIQQRLPKRNWKQLFNHLHNVYNDND